MRTYLVIADDTPEAGVALRFAARRAAKTGGAVKILALAAPAEFLAFGGVQATIEDEARRHAEALVRSAAGAIVEESGVRPSIEIRSGDPVAAICAALSDDPEIDALVLGAAATGAAGPLVAHFAGADAGRMSCPIMIVPGNLDAEALDRLS
ncbi:UspA domain-containing protein [Sphingomonas antarctica]|uniref:universal stress protein n=1 Tax=Sphingomonas antarctica TaxID=2040274 RepID=UPI0039E84151